MTEPLAVILRDLITTIDDLHAEAADLRAERDEARNDLGAARQKLRDAETRLSLVDGLTPRAFVERDEAIRDRDEARALVEEMRAMGAKLAPLIEAWADTVGPWTSGNPDHVGGAEPAGDLYNALVKMKRSGALARWSGGSEAKPEPVIPPEPSPGDVRDLLLDFFDLPFPDRHKLIVKWFGGRPAGTEEEVVNMALGQAVRRGTFDAMAADVAKEKRSTDG